MEMATAKQITKQVIKTYTAVVQVKDATQQKLDGLLATQASYTLFENDETHPYYSLASSGSVLLAYYEDLIGGLKGWKIGSGTLEDELDKLRAAEIVNDAEPDSALDALRQIKPKRLNAENASEKLMANWFAATMIWSRADNAVTKWELEKRHGKRNVGRHLEVPLLSINPLCRAATKEVKKLATMLLDVVKGKTTIRQELERKQLLKGKDADSTVSALLRR